ncbi:MAG: hypothetical protein HYX75_04875 [Acidobacteria bacterium]|nr:hypothetical protein [Acidobacteriota bacterium]
MRDNTDRQLSEWSEAWREESRQPEINAADLRRRVRRRTAGLLAISASEVFLAIGMLGLLWWAMSRSPALFDRIVLGSFALLVVAVLGFAHYNRRDIWSASAQTTRAYLDLCIRRCDRRLRTVRAQWGVLLFEIVLFIPWLAHRIQLLAESHQRPLRLWDYAWPYLFLAAAGLLAAISLVWLKRYTIRELRSLEELKREARDLAS